MTTIEIPTGIFEGAAFKSASISMVKPNYSMSFHTHERIVGSLNFNGPEMTFEGDASASAKVFFSYLAKRFEGRLSEARELDLQLGAANAEIRELKAEIRELQGGANEH